MIIHAAWQRCVTRFSQVEDFINETAALPRGGPASVRTDLYGGWVLMTYAACQYSLDELGRAAMQFLGNRFRYPRNLPVQLLDEHQVRTIDYIRGMREDGALSATDMREALQCMDSRDWAASSKLLIMNRNVWPDNVREWLKRLGIDGNACGWMDDSVPSSSETYRSRMSALVRERNPIAHGTLPSNILGAQAMKDWLTECRAFMESCAVAVELQLAQQFNLRRPPVGRIAKGLLLGNRTLALQETTHDLRVGDHLIIRSQGEYKKIVRVTSLMRLGVNLDTAPARTTQLAVGVSKPHANGTLHLAP